MNQRGDFILYIIFTIVLLLIGAILVYVYMFPADANNNANNNTISFNNQYLSKNIIETAYSKQYPIKTKFKLDMRIDVSDKNVLLYGKPKIMISERQFSLKEPILSGFSGAITKSGLEGNVNSISSKEYELDLRSSIFVGLEEVDKLIIEEMYLDLESPNISGELDIAGKSRTLEKSYLQIKGFNGKLTILPDLDKEFATLVLDGNVGYLKYIDGVEETILK
jgi:hypothetical protein